MTSPDGINWTLRTGILDNQWTSVCYGNGLFVAVADYGANCVMISRDGITWGAGPSASDFIGWSWVTYGNGLFVAVARSGGTNTRVMTSTDGLRWTLRPTPIDNQWNTIAYGNGIFVAGSQNGTAANRFMTSSLEW